MANSPVEEWLPDYRVDAYLDEEIARLKERLAEGEKELLPHLLVVNMDADQNITTTLVLLQMPEGERRFQMMDGIGAKLVLESRRIPLACYLLSEGWLVEYERDEPLTLQPKDDPRRESAIFLHGQTLDGRKVGLFWKTTYDDAGNLRLADKPHIDARRSTGVQPPENYLCDRFFRAVRMAMWMVGNAPGKPN